MWIPVNNSTTNVLYKRQGVILFFEYKKQLYLEPSFHSHFVTIDFIEKCITLLFVFSRYASSESSTETGQWSEPKTSS